MESTSTTLAAENRHLEREREIFPRIRFFDLRYSEFLASNHDTLRVEDFSDVRGRLKYIVRIENSRKEENWIRKREREREEKREKQVRQLKRGRAGAGRGVVWPGTEKVGDHPGHASVSTGVGL